MNATQTDDGPRAPRLVPAGHELTGPFDPARLDRWPRTKATYLGLVGKARNATSRRQLGNVAHALVTLQAKGSRKFGPSTLGAETELRGGPTAKTLSNPASQHHRSLIDAFTEEAGTGAASGGSGKGKPEGRYDAIIHSIDKHSHRTAIQHLVRSEKHLRSQVEILKAQLTAVAPILAGLPADGGDGGPSAPRTEGEAGPSRDERWRETVRAALPAEGATLGYVLLRGGALWTARTDELVFPSAVVTAIRGLAGPG